MRYRAPDPSPWWLKVARLDYYARRTDPAWSDLCDRIRSTPSGEAFYYRVRGAVYAPSGWLPSQPSRARPMARS